MHFNTASMLHHVIVWLMLSLPVISCSGGDDTSRKPEPGAAVRALLATLDWGKDTTFVYGHKIPDVDAVASSLSYAKLMRALGYNCKAKTSSPVNRETRYIAGRFGFALPELKTEVTADTRLVLTDHTDYAQCVDGARAAVILQKIDHHVEGDISDATIPYVRREMVGSTCSIIYECYQELGIGIDDETAGILLAGIVSDTRNLTKTTTRGIDSLAWQVLVSQLRLQDQIDDINRQMAEAAYNYDGMTDSEILLSDYKEYEIGNHLIGFGSLSCKKAESETFIARMLAAMPAVMRQQQRDMMFAKIDNLVPNPDTSASGAPYLEEGIYFLYYGPGAKSVAEAIFGSSVAEGVTYTPENLSRKQIVPKITELLQ